MIFHPRSNHPWSVAPELALLLFTSRPAREPFSFRRSVPAGRLGRRWFCRPE